MDESALGRILRLSGQTEEFIELTRYVRTPEGVKRYGKPIGAILGTAALKKMKSGTMVHHIDYPTTVYTKRSDGFWENIDTGDQYEHLTGNHREVSVDQLPSLNTKNKRKKHPGGVLKQLKNLERDISASEAKMAKVKRNMGI